MRTLILTALALGIATWYASHRCRVMAREQARHAVERWEDEGGAVRGRVD